MQLTGLKTKDANIIRNDGGRASDDAIRSLLISNRLVGTSEWLIIHHTGCRIENITNDKMAGLARESYNTSEGDYINWLTIRDSIESIRNDVKRLREHPLTPPEVSISGNIYDIETGMLTEVSRD